MEVLVYIYYKWKQSIKAVVSVVTVIEYIIAIGDGIEYEVDEGVVEGGEVEMSVDDCILSK